MALSPLEIRYALLEWTEDGDIGAHDSHFYTGQQATNLAVLFAARSRFRQKVVNWGSVLVCQFAAWEGILISASSAI